MKDKKRKYQQLIAASSYLLIGVIWYFIDEKAKKDDFTKFHVQQGIVFLIACLIFSLGFGIIFRILSLILSVIPFLGKIIIFLLGLFRILPLIWAILGIVNVLDNKKKNLPLIGHFGKKIKI